MSEAQWLSMLQRYGPGRVLLSTFFFIAIAYSIIQVFVGSIFKRYPIYLSGKYKSALELHSTFYRRLTGKAKRRFELRVQQFINYKKFVSRSQDLEISPEKKARIAAAAVELTFGFRRFEFEQFDRILIYADDYYSKITRKYHRGEVNKAGFIVLSWAAFEEGYADAQDGINLGIHEMAHALKLENRIKNANYQFFEPHAFGHFLAEYDHLKAIIKAGQDPVLRSYAATNSHEFFAIVCENFLERPEQLKKHHPKLYQQMVKLLKQDPLALGVKSV